MQVDNSYQAQQTQQVLSAPPAPMFASDMAQQPDPMAEHQARIAYEKAKLHSQMRSSAGWFTWVAALSVVNSVLSVTGQAWVFFIGLGITQLIDGFAYGYQQETGTDLTLVALVLSVSISAVFFILGRFASKGHTWAFVTGMTLYAMDGLLFLLVQDFASLAFHGLALFFMFRGLKAVMDFGKLQQANTMLPGVWAK
jgi:hypothetical protein